MLYLPYFYDLAQQGLLEEDFTGYDEGDYGNTFRTEFRTFVDEEDKKEFPELQIGDEIKFYEDDDGFVIQC